MAKKLSKDFFLNNEVLVLGYPLKDDPSMKMILKACIDNGIRVLAMNAQATGDTDVKLYKSFGELPRKLETAVACLLMLLGGGIHRLHAFLAGVR